MVDQTLKALYDCLQKMEDSYSFKFHIVDMREIEKRYNVFDDTLMMLLSNSEIEYLNNLKINKNKIQWISGRYAAKYALFVYKLDNNNIMDLSCIDILKGADSAPFIVQYPSLRVSISHSYPYCIAVISECRIGIDLERVFEPEESLIRYFFCINEKNMLKNYNGVQDYSDKAMIMWTRKEAVSKLFGLGMKMNFAGLDASKDIFYSNEPYNNHIRLLSNICDDFCVSVAISP